MKFIFFGTPKLSVIVLDELLKKNLLPSLIITAPDKPFGRGMKVAQSPVKIWALEHNIKTLEPEAFTDEIIQEIVAIGADVFVLVAYGHILPQKVIDIPRHGILNVHPSLLPKLRGPSPIRSAILEDQKTVGVSVMLLDSQMDHGPILIQKKYTPTVWPPDAQALDRTLFTLGGSLLAEVLPKYLAGEIHATEQDHSKATYSKLFKKEDGLLDLTEDAYTNLLKIHAYTGWPGTYVFNQAKIRIKILSAHIDNSALVLDEVIPEGKNKMSFEQYKQQMQKD